MTVELAAGSTFAGYRIDSLVARGGMGVVYRARDLSLDRPVALKLIAPGLAEDERFRRRFLKEARLAASLDHPSVVPVFEAGEHEGTLYLAMRFVEGSDLKTLLRSAGTPAPERVLLLLAQVAGALDAAHRRGLVHRDVKPGNVLVDADGHAYLTDFGVSKQLAGDTTDTGRMVGTLDYISPEQIRGQPVDGRADEYALACVLYECLTGAPPFRRETEGETLWAHMQQDAPPLLDHPALDPVLKKGLAKEPGDRYPTCAALIDAAFAPPGVKRALVRRRHAILAAGLLVLAATAAFALSAGGGQRPPPAGNGVAAIGANGDARSFTRVQTAATNIAVGDGAIWVINSEDASVSRIDPSSGRIVKTLKTTRRPVDVAVGYGALWLMNADPRLPSHRGSVSRIDPDTGAVAHTAMLPRTPDRGGWLTPGHPGIAVGAGGVWAGNREGTISRFDPATGRVVATIDAFARRLAAGDAGVWVLGLDVNTITRIDPRTNRVGESIDVGTNAVSGLAVGAGSVWATSEEGRLWRIEPGPRPVMNAIDIGVGTEFVAFGGGMVWTANYVDGTVSRIDPRTNTVEAKAPVGATQAIAAGAGSAWVSLAGGTQDGVLPASMCDELSTGGAQPDVLLVSDLPLQGEVGADSQGMAATIRHVLERHRYRAGRFAIGFRSCDDSTAQSGAVEQRKCAANANAYTDADGLVAVIGPVHSICARVELPILNSARGGPLALVSPSNTFPNLTRGGRLSLPPPNGSRGEPGVYYPTGERSYFRVIAREDQEGVAQAMLAARLGLRKVYLLYAPSDGSDVIWTGPFRRAAARLGVGIAGEADLDSLRLDEAGIARRVARSGADGVVVGAGDGATVRALRARLGPRAVLMAGNRFEDIPDVLELAGPAARGLYVATTELTAEAPGLTAAATRFADDLGATAHGAYALQTAQATEVVLAAIARSDGTRASVLRQLHRTQVRGGLLGDFRFDGGGDILPARVTILRVTGRTPKGVELPAHLRGAVVDRVLTVPARLAE